MRDQHKVQIPRVKEFHRKTRDPKACSPCRNNKKRCHGGAPCARCIGRGEDCDLLTELPGTWKPCPRPITDERTKRRLEIVPSIFGNLDETIFQIYPLNCPIVSPFHSCPANDPNPIHYAFQLAMMSLALLFSGKKDKSQQYLIESNSVLDEACPQDHLLACITYLKLVLPSRIPSLNKSIVAMFLDDAKGNFQCSIT